MTGLIGCFINSDIYLWIKADSGLVRKASQQVSYQYYLFFSSRRASVATPVPAGSLMT